MKLYNTLTRKLDDFKPIKPNFVGIYSCGPTVYWNQHIGNMYAYVQWDSLVRTFRYLGFKVKWVMNITDVGHLTSDEDSGEDKMEKGAKREGLSVWKIADKYIQQFKESLSALNITPPDVMCRATEHIQEQIDLIKKIELNGFTYHTQTGLVFDTSKFSAYAEFSHLNLDQQYAGARVEVDSEKKKPWDFLLWVTNQPNHIMQWDSPWGKGFPGWHIECTAMSTKYLGEQFDIHTGGKEHIPVHHTNEIAQAYGAFGRQTANYWLHNEWLMFDGQKISKSLGNNVLVGDLINKGYNPLTLRYLVLNSHYRTGLNFSWKSLEGAQTALNRLYDIVSELKQRLDLNGENKNLSEPEEEKKWQQKFVEALENDFNMPQALALAWELIKSNLSDQEKYALLLDWDQVFGLNLAQNAKLKIQNFEYQAEKSKVLIISRSKLTQDLLKLIDERELARQAKNFSKADQIRQDLESQGFKLKDQEGKILINKK
ncbi:cysteine--tRNA ligase [Candidatus Beckwithbacteria bacterium]|nr:cysteine--tRNA ligase [Candidatus Beckwithbacteria bacterium]